MEQRYFIQHCVGIYTVLQDSYFQQRYYHMVHKKEEGTYHHIEKLTKEMPESLIPGRGLPLLLIPYVQELIRNREFLTDPKQHIGSLLLNAS